MSLEEKMSIPSFSFAEEGESCHEMYYQKDAGLQFISVSSETEIKLLLWRSGMQCTGTDDIVPIINIMTICNHHHALYLKRFSKHVKKACFDPLKVHKKAKSKFKEEEKNSNSFFWPTCDDKCWVPLQHVLLKLTVPTTRNGKMNEFFGDEINNLKLMKLPLP